MNIYIQKWSDFLVRNRSPQMKSQDYQEMLSEYEYLPQYDFAKRGNCEACDHEIIHHYCIRNMHTNAHFYVGCDCIDKVKDKGEVKENRSIEKVRTKYYKDKALAYLKKNFNHAYQTVLQKKKISFKQATQIIKDTNASVYVRSIKVQKPHITDKYPDTLIGDITAYFGRTKAEMDALHIQYQTNRIEAIEEAIAVYEDELAQLNMGERRLLRDMIDLYGTDDDAHTIIRSLLYHHTHRQIIMNLVNK